MSPESPDSASGNMGINRDSRRPAVTENRGCEKAYQGEFSAGVFAVGWGKDVGVSSEMAYRSDTVVSQVLPGFQVLS